jgi:hypothetical protein
MPIGGLQVRSSLGYTHTGQQTSNANGAAVNRIPGYDLFNARITGYNATIQAYLADAQVYRTRIEAETRKVELYKAQIDAQKLVGDINQQLVAMYREQINAQMARVDIELGRIVLLRIEPGRTGRHDGLERREDGVEVGHGASSRWTGCGCAQQGLADSARRDAPHQHGTGCKARPAARQGHASPGRLNAGAQPSPSPKPSAERRHPSRRMPHP